MPKAPKGVFKRGPSWYVRDQRGYRDRWICLGRDWDAAVRRCNEIRRSSALGHSRTVAELADHWQRDYLATRRKGTGARDAMRRVERYVLPLLGRYRVASLGPEHMRALAARLKESGLGESLRWHVHSDVHCLLQFGEEVGATLRNPCPRGWMPKLAQHPPDRLTDDEVAAVVALDGDAGFVCRLGLATGLRWGEMVRARRADIETTVDGVHLLVRESKAGKVRRVPLGRDIVEEIMRRPDPLVPFKWGETFARLVRRHSGVTRFHAHQLRHTFACRWLEAGGSLPALQLVLGHSSVIMTQRYGGLSDAAVMREASRVESVAREGAGGS